MSRIDEALKRAGAAHGPYEERRGSTLVMEPRTSVVDPTSLDRYASEHHTLTPTAPLVSTNEAPRRVRSAVSAPTVVRHVKRIAVAPSQEGKLVISPEIAPYTVEQYRRLATVLNDLRDQRGVKTLMVSSAAPREGKTHTITNLALTLSESFQQHVMLIDADLRRPSLHDVFAVPVSPGLVDVVRTPAMALPVVEISSHLSLLTAGRTGATPLAYLSSDALPGIVSAAAAQFDWVLIDTPPIGLLPDAQLVARISEAVLFVVGAGVTPYGFVQRGIAALGPERIVGVVLNRVDESVTAVDSYYGHYPAS
jgi:capsular exopolysaccharide synthesis family protein